jgi:hypothetical protein
MRPMNYFAHARHFLDQPYWVAGTGVPDWLSVVDRQVRIRPKHAEAFQYSDCPRVAAVAGGVLQHLRDDAHFHRTRAFAETSLELSRRAGRALPAVCGLQPPFLGHLLVEVLLDAELIAENPSQLDAYYRVLDSVDATDVEAAVNGMAPRSTRRLALLISHFRRERILWNYLEDDKLMLRLNQVMGRVRLPPLPDEFIAVLPAARSLVAAKKDALLEGIPSGVVDVGESPHLSRQG